MRAAIVVALVLIAGGSDVVEAANSKARLVAHAYRKPWTPYDLGPTVLSAWWSADDYGTRMTDDGAGVISSWRDRIASLAVTATTTARPTYGATAFNSAYPGLTFDGAANTLATTTLTGLPTGSTAGTIVVVATGSATGALSIPLNYGATSGAALRRISKAATDLVTGSDGASFCGASAVSITSVRITLVDYSGTTMNCYVNGTASTPGTIASLNTSATRLRIGASTATTAANFFNGVVADAFVLTTVLSTSDRQKLEGYEAWHFGFASSLPSTHPYRWAPP